MPLLGSTTGLYAIQQPPKTATDYDHKNGIIRNAKDPKEHTQQEIRNLCQTNQATD